MLGGTLSSLHINSRNLYNLPLRYGVLGKQDPEKLSDLLKVAHLLSGRATTQTWAVWL